MDKEEKKPEEPITSLPPAATPTVASPPSEKNPSQQGQIVQNFECVKGVKRVSGLHKNQLQEGKNLGEWFRLPELNPPPFFFFFSHSTKLIALFFFFFSSMKVLSRAVLTFSWMTNTWSFV
jgi:hypothetical protein